MAAPTQIPQKTHIIPQKTDIHDSTIFPCIGWVGNRKYKLLYLLWLFSACSFSLEGHCQLLKVGITLQLPESCRVDRQNSGTWMQLTHTELPDSSSFTFPTTHSHTPLPALWAQAWWNRELGLIARSLILWVPSGRQQLHSQLLWCTARTWSPQRQRKFPVSVGII